MPHIWLANALPASITLGCMQYFKCSQPWRLQDLAAKTDTGGAAPHIPDARGVLAPAKDLVFNDAPWVPDQRARFVHARLSHQVLVVPLCYQVAGSLSTKLKPTAVAGLFAGLRPGHAACKAHQVLVPRFEQTRNGSEYHTQASSTAWSAFKACCPLTCLQSLLPHCALHGTACLSFASSISACR